MPLQPDKQLFTATTSPPTSPVNVVPTGSAFDSGKNPEPGMALCLSGGGYRAMLFHAGTLWRLYEADLLRGMKRISSVSGGSITAAVLGLKWKELSFKPSDVRDGFVQKVVAPIRRLADRTIDANSVIGGIFLPGTISEKITKEYREHLFGNATLQDLPPEDKAPRFVICATNVQSGVLWRFYRSAMGDYRVGMVPNPKASLATAVAASSAFPPVLSPCELKIEAGAMQKLEGNDLHEPPYTTHVVLTDGGVYDNLGLETIWKRYDTILVSDAGGQFDAEPEPKEDWARHAYRVLNLVDSQVRSLRKRQVIDAYMAGGRNGAYWGIRTNIADYKLSDALPCDFKRTTELSNTPTRLKRLSSERQERLINWGYAVCDAAIRKHVDSAISRPAGWPYPGALP